MVDDNLERNSLLDNNISALHTGAARFSKVLAKETDGILIVSTRGEILYCNQPADKMLKSRDPEYIGNIFNIPFGQTEKVEILTRESMAGTVVLDFRTVEMWIAPIVWHGEIVYVATLRDITECVLLEKDQLLHTTALESTANAIVITDVQGDIQWVNSAFIRLTGYLPEEVYGKNTRFLKSDKHDRKFYAEMWNTILDGKVWHGEVINKRKDGSLYTEEMTITPVCVIPDKTTHFIAIKEDVTERKQTEKEIKEAEERFRALSEFAAEWIFWRGADGSLNYISPACLRISGYTQQELYDDPDLMEKIIFPEDRPIWHEHLGNLHYAQQEMLKPLEFRILTKAGEIRWISHICRPLYNSRREFMGVRASNTDITERVLAEEKMRLASKVFDNTSEGVLVTDVEGIIRFANQAFSRISGYTEAEVIGKTPSILSSGRHEKSFYSEMWNALNITGEWQGEIWNRRKNGEVYPEWLTISAIKDGYGKVTQYAAVFSDLTARKQDEERIKHLAYHDALTGLPNRFLFADRLQLAMAHARRNRAKLAVMFLDLDRFKYINDSLGHAAGDQLLQEVATRLSACVREDDTVARMGGDEFTLLLPGIRAVEDVAKIAQKIIDTLKASFRIGDRDLYITVSIGIAMYPNDGLEADALLSHADAAMYRAKEQGRNNYQLYTPNLNEAALERMNLEQGIRHAIERNEFILHYQPQVNVRTGKIAGVEALLRWQSPELGLVSPMRFIPLAEDTGLIIPIGEWVLGTACTQNMQWQKNGYPPLRMAVNLSARQFQQGDLVEKVASILETTGLEPCWLELEITESIAMQDVEFTAKTLREFKQMGVHIAIDDFGTGYSSLNYLKKFPISTLKIDQAFISDSMTNLEDAAIVSSILVLAQSLEYKAIAEGVETQEQFEFLQKRDCDEIQGFLFGKSMAPQDFERLLEQRLAEQAQ